VNKENTEKLFADFPRLFKGKDLGMQANLMCFGFEFGDGWFDLIYQLCADLEEEYQKLSPEAIAEAGDDSYIVFQAKEKFGGLRFYMDSGTEEMYNLASAAEEKSFTICEYCGKEGKPRRGGWIKTLCDQHHDEQEAKRQEYKMKASLRVLKVKEQRKKEENGN
jgi:hypothetical protein